MAELWIIFLPFAYIYFFVKGFIMSISLIHVLVWAGFAYGGYWFRGRYAMPASSAPASVDPRVQVILDQLNAHDEAEKKAAAEKAKADLIAAFTKKPPAPQA
jgi:hypothetical protein